LATLKNSFPRTVSNYL